MHTGAYISATVHGLILLWLLIGGVFLSARDPLPVSTTDVTVISSEEFARMMASDVPPAVSGDTPSLVDPKANEPSPKAAAVSAAPAMPTAAQPAPDASTPDASPVPLPPLQDQTPVDDTAPQPVAPPAEEPVSVVAPSNEPPTPAPAPRVAPTPAPAPAPDAEIAEVTTPQRAPDPAAADAPPEKPATAREQAATQIVTEAEKPASRAPARSVRPKSRPKPKPEPANKPAPSNQDAVAAAVAAAMASGNQPARAAPAGPPLTSAEKDAFRIAVRDCWVVDVGSQAANVTVTVGFSLDRSGKVVGGNVQLIGHSGGEGSVLDAAFQAARRAVLRCQKSGYKLPPEKYETWRNVEMTFNPKEMRIK